MNDKKPYVVVDTSELEAQSLEDVLCAAHAAGYRVVSHVLGYGSRQIVIMEFRDWAAGATVV
jgi:DNA-binding LacI/PurR family transcriptional regulator